MSDIPSDTDRRNELARERTEAAVHRTFLSEQRTYSAWIRTGLASTATGFAIAKLMAESNPDWLTKSLATVFILAGALMFLLAFSAYRDAIRRLEEKPKASVPMWVMALLSGVLAIAAVAGLYLVNFNTGSN
ncbi:MAG: hypothetical protein CMJ46_00050 [Planctomyces sp.]|nr:hypothetical protein [Planctomyces sp.]